MADSREFVTVRPGDLSGRERYDLLTSVIVPRPIGWISTRSGQGNRNLAPFSFFNALATSPPMVGVSIGFRGDEPKDTLRNIRETGAFCVNVCSEDLLEAMNLTSGEFGPSVDEFQVAGLTPMDGEVVEAAWVAEAPVAMECRLFEEVPLGESKNVLVIGEVLAIHLAPWLERLPESWAVSPESLRPLGRLGRDRYLLSGKVRELPRPK